MFADLAFLQRKRQRDERKNVRIKKQYVIRVRDEEYSLIVTKQCKKKEREEERKKKIDCDFGLQGHRRDIGTSGRPTGLGQGWSGLQNNGDIDEDDDEDVDEVDEDGDEENFILREHDGKYSGLPNLERVQPRREPLAPATSLPVGVFKLEVLP